MERLNDFPGSKMARKMLTLAGSTRGADLERLETQAGALGDLFFMKYRLEHYDVPQEFADIKTAGVRVFDDDEGRRVAQISVPEKRMQFFIFPAERDPKDGKPKEFSGWKYLEHEGWAGVAKFKCWRRLHGGDARRGEGPRAIRARQRSSCSGGAALTPPSARPTLSPRARVAQW